MSQDAGQKTGDLETPTPKNALERRGSAQNLARTVDRARTKSSSRRRIRLGISLAVTLAVVVLIWYSRRPPLATETQPTLTSITETIASSGRVGGATETLVGVQTQGVVNQLYV